MARCDAEKFTERIKDNKTLTDKDILECEVFLRECIANCQELNKVLNIFLVRKKRQQDEKNYPTAHEETKAAARQPKKRWWRF